MLATNNLLGVKLKRPEEREICNKKDQKGENKTYC